MRELGEIRDFLFSGNATGTLETPAWRFTYKVKRAPRRGGATVDPSVWFVSVLSGPDNESDYRYIGTVFADGALRHTAKSTVDRDALSFRGLARLLATSETALPDGCEFMHAGRCGACGRKLTTPESLRTGLGPVCASRQ